MKRIAALLCSAAAWPAFAHEGHGATAIHWHASDTYGFLLVALLAGIAFWLAQGE